MPRKRFRKEMLIDYLNSWIFVILIVTCMLIILAGLLNYCINTSYIIGLLNFFNVTILITCMFFIPLLITTTNIFNIFNKNQFLMIRFSSKKEKLIELLKNIFYSNTIVFIIIFVMVLIGLNITCASDLGFMTKYWYYDIPNFVYVLFYVIRTYILTMIISLFNGVLLEKISSKIVIFLNIIFYGILFVYPYVPVNGKRTSILDSSFLIFEYFQINSYANFFTEIICSVFAILLLVLFLKLVIYLLYNTGKKNSFKYILSNDISYIINDNKYLLIGYFAFLIILSFLKLFVINYNDNIFNSVLGLQADLNDDYLNVIIFFINILVYIFIGTKLFIQDLSKNKCNIFLRITKSNWTIMKIISLILVFGMILLGGYFITFIILTIFDSIPTNIAAMLYFTNLIFLILLELLVLMFIYGNLLYKIMIGIGGILFLVFNYMCIANMCNYIFYLFILLIITAILSIMFFNKRIYRLFEGVGLR